MRSELTVVLPVDDPAAPSGGNRYDRRLCDGLVSSRALHEVRIAGDWPRPGDRAREALRATLAGLPDGATVLLDGLIACGVPEILEPQAARLHLVVLVHLPLGDETGLDELWARRLTAREGRVLHACAAVVTTSHAAARRLVGVHALAPERVHVVAPGVDPAPLTAPSAHGGRLLCVAAVIPRKGQDVLVDALGRLDTERWTCVCAGAVDRDPAFSAPLTGRDPRITFPGPRIGAALDDTYAAADLLILPSRAETYGMVVTEALARGIPVLGTEVPGVREALGGGGHLVAPGDAAALADALRDWLTDAGVRARWRRAALRRRTGLHGWDETVRLMGEVLDHDR